jgi:WD40 repeat protein
MKGKRRFMGQLLVEPKDRPSPEGREYDSRPAGIFDFSQAVDTLFSKYRPMKRSCLMRRHSFRIAFASLTLLVLVAEGDAGPPPRNTPKHPDLYGDPLPDGALARMGTERLRHPHALRVVFAADGETLISAGQDQTVRFWDLASGKLKRLQLVPQSQRVVALSPDGKTLALAGEEHLHLWDIAAAKEVQRIAAGKLTDKKRLLWVEFSPDGKTLAGGDADSTVLVWDTAAGKERTRFKHKDGKVHNLAFSPDGNMLAATGMQHILLCDPATGKELRTLESRHGADSRLSFSPDGKRLADAMFNSVVFWDAATGEKSTTLEFFDAGKKRTTGHEVAFAPDGKTVAVYCNEDGFVVLWDPTTHKEVKRLNAYYSHNWNPGWLGFSPDGKRLASVRSGKITLWDVSSGKQLQERASHFAATESVAISPKGAFLASASGGDHSVRLWDARTGKPLHVWPMPHNRIHPLLFTADSASLIAGGWLGESRLWDARSGEQRCIFRVPEVAKYESEQVTALRLAPDGKRLTALALRAELEDGIPKRQRYLTTWKVATGERVERRALVFHSRILPVVEGLSPDGRFATASDGGGLLIYDVVADRPVRVLTGNILAPVAFSPDGKLIAFSGNYSPVAGMERVHIQDLTSGVDVLTLAAGRVWERAFSPDGRYLLTASDGDLRLWELATGKEVLRRHVAAPPTAPGNPWSFATCLAFAVDGRSAATGMHDTNLVLWDLAPATRQKRKLSADDLHQLWADLAGEDAAKAYDAAGTLSADPERTLTFLRERLHPIKEDGPRIRRLIADLDSEQFAVRDAARKELEKMGDAAHAVLRQAMSDAKSLETRRRIQSLLSDSWLIQSPEKLRQVRAVMVLEQIGDTEARRQLKQLATGAAQARQTREAKMAFRRLVER